MSNITQHRPHGALAGLPYGSFSGKTPEPPPPAVQAITQHRPHGALAGMRYGSFEGRGSVPTIGTVTPAETTVTFTHSGGGTHYRVYLLAGSPGSWVSLGASPVTVTGLTANTEYTLDISGDGSTVADTENFGTLNPGGGGGGIGYDLTVQDATHAHTVDSLVLTTTSVLAIADATHAHTADNLTLTLGGTTLTIQDATHAHTADSLTLAVNYVDLAIADARHAHTADNITLTGDVEAPAPPPAPTPGGGGGGYSPSTKSPLARRLQLEQERRQAEEAEVLDIIMALAAAGVLD